jgi:quercetin dioxygenase-like cupin family protein
VRRRLTVYDLAPGSCSPFDAAAARYVFVVDGTVCLDAPDGSAVLSAGHGAPIPAAADLAVHGTAWLCESAPAETGLADPAQASVVLSKSFDFPEASEALFRVDRIDLTAGARTPVHFHRGPGIRRLLYGRVRVAIGDDVLGVGPGGAWFEPGDEPVLGENAEDGASAFLRVSLLPIELIGGKSSFRPASAAEAAKPRAVGQGLLHERAVALD